MNALKQSDCPCVRPLTDKEHLVVQKVTVAAVNCATSIIFDQRHMFDEHTFKPKQKRNIEAELQAMVCDLMAGVATEF